MVYTMCIRIYICTINEYQRTFTRTQSNIERDRQINTLPHTYVTRFNTLQTLPPTAIHCDYHTLQHTTTHCNTLPHTATHYHTLQHTATHCTTLPHTASLHHTAPHTPWGVCTRAFWCPTHDTYPLIHCWRAPCARNTLQHTATHYHTLPHTATHCTTLHTTTLHHTHLEAFAREHFETRLMTRIHWSIAREPLAHATHCNTQQHTATHCHALHHTASLYTTTLHHTHLEPFAWEHFDARPMTHIPPFAHTQLICNGCYIY